VDPVRIYEVTPRDGLQNEASILPTSAKVRLVEQLVAAGHKDIEVTSLVKPNWIPQLSDANAVLTALRQPPDGVRYWALIPNRRGLDRAMDCGLGHVATFLSASDTHNRKNLNRTRRESLSNLQRVVGDAVNAGLSVRAYLSTAFGCPYEGAVHPQRVVDMVMQLRSFGAQEIALGDTTGMAVPTQVRDIVDRLSRAGVDLGAIALHMHDTRGTALANVLAGYEGGIRTFDAATAGVGGCPYAPGAAGNAATEDLIYMFTKMGCETGVDLTKTAEIGVFLANVLNRDLPGRYHQFHTGRLASCPIPSGEATA